MVNFFVIGVVHWIDGVCTSLKVVTAFYDRAFQTSVMEVFLHLRLIFVSVYLFEVLNTLLRTCTYIT